MFKNYIKTAWRNLVKNKGFTAINVFGLALGLATCLLIIFYVFDELSYDTYNNKADRIYRINEDIKFGNNTSSDALASAPLAGILKTEFPEVENTVRFRLSDDIYVKKNNENIEESKVIYADPALFDVFTLPFIDGDTKTALIEPHSLVINETTAKKYFGKTNNVIGRTLTVNDTVSFKVTGVMKDIPHQSHFNFDFIISMPTLKESRETTWLRNNFNTYVLFKKGAFPQSLEAKFPKLVQKYIGPQLQGLIHQNINDFEKTGNYFRLSLIPLLKIHLGSNRTAELGTNGNIQYVYIFSAIGIFILLIACVNFMNLSTARSSNRAREVGVRKVLGSSRVSLIMQFLTESFLVTLIATIIAILVAWALLPLFNQLSGKQLFVTSQLMLWLLPLVSITVVIISLLAGFYPAFFLSGFQVIAVLKGKLSTGFKGKRLRGFLVVFQFSFSIFLIIGTLVIYNQLKYIQSKDLGYNRNQVLVLKNVKALGLQSEVFKKEVKNIPGVVNATLTGFLPTADYRSNISLFQDPTLSQTKSILTQFWTVDEDYVNTLGMKLTSGRNFSSKILTDSSGLIINETAAKLMGVKDPMGKALYSLVDLKTTKRLDKYNIIGVVKDFNFSSLRENISPVMLVLGKDHGSLSIRINSENIPALITQIENKWKLFSPLQHINYSFMDEEFDANYRSEQRAGKIFISFSTLAIIIACLGLLGLAAYSAEQRTKEIGIRKVLGASVAQVTALLSKDFVVLVILAILIASPIAFFTMQKWLQDFAYRIQIQWWMFALAGSLAIVIALLTISFQAVKAALANPVKSLRSE